MSLNTLHVSIYHLYHPLNRRFILCACAGIAILTPFSDTVYLPALNSISDAFDTNDTMVALTVSIYLACVGIGQLIWGPLSDYYGRMYVLYGTLTAFEAFTIGCIFVTDINQLIILRSFEGLVVGSALISAQAIIADVFPPDERGSAMAAFLAPMLVGPVIAPLIGGVVADKFGWQATFVLLAIVLLPILAMTKFAISETHPWYVVRRHNRLNAQKQAQYEKKRISTSTSIDDTTTTINPVHIFSTSIDIPIDPKVFLDPETPPPLTGPVITTSYDPSIALDVAEKLPHHLIAMYETEHIATPIFVTPWTTLLYIFDTTLTPYYCLHFMGFGLMFTTLTLISLELAKDPYNLSEATIGITYLSVGAGQLIGSMVGGWASDLSAMHYPAVVEGRMLYSIPGMIAQIVGTFGFAYAIDYGASLALVLIAHFVLGLGQAVLMSACLGYFPALKPLNAAGVSSVSLCLCFVSAAVFITIAGSVSDAIGFANFFVILTGLYTLICLWCSSIIISKVFPPSPVAASGSPNTTTTSLSSPVVVEVGGDSLSSAKLLPAVV